MQGLPYRIKFVGSGVLHLSIPVQNCVYPALYLREAHDRRRHPLEVGIYAVLYAAEEGCHLPERVKHSPELSERYEINGRRSPLQRLEEVYAVYESARRETVLKHHDKPHLVRQEQPPADLGLVCRKGFCRSPLRRICSRASV